ncbi:purine nucleoside phosphorylase [Clostridia bacterium]|nr:purine nucleoside phosphorylase [Clostridia bacterium]
MAMIMGSGLGFIGDLVENPIAVPYAEVPHLKPSTAPGHAGRFVFGTLGGKSVAVMQGRVHFYEGNSFEEVAFGVTVLALIGCKTLIVTNASGAVNLSYMPGDIMLITDHIKLCGFSPLHGQNLYGDRFPDMSDTYSPGLQALAGLAAVSLQIELKEGVYMLFTGPQYETPAEIRAARLLGADAVGMSTVPEVIAARHMGMQILGLSLICNMAAGVRDQRLSEEEVLESAARAKPYFSKLILKCLELM